MIVYGLRTRSRMLGQISAVCPKCQRNTYHTVARATRWFTLFWIPIFPFRTITSARCNLCGLQQKVDGKQVDAILAQTRQ